MDFSELVVSYHRANKGPTEATAVKSGGVQRLPKIKVGTSEVIAWRLPQCKVGEFEGYHSV